jgi:hypothetical protein
MHCICKGRGVEYLGVKGTAESKADALKQIENLNTN